MTLDELSWASVDHSVNVGISIDDIKYEDFKIPYITSLTLNGGQELSFLLDGNTIYQFLGSKIKVDTTVTRRLVDFKSDFIFTSATDDFYNYIQINSPNNTVNFIPEFTNLSAGNYTCVITNTVNNCFTNLPQVAVAINTNVPTASITPNGY